MIKVRRNREDDEGNTIKPNHSWFKRSIAKKKIALKEKNKHIFSRNIYGAKQVKMALEKLFHRKCAYCEIDLSRVEWDVEHFRPKGRVKERRSHPGYYWLAYTWDNLYPSCAYCNRNRKARPRWGEKSKQFGGGKVDQFPVDGEATRAMIPTDDLRMEKRLLLDPCEDDPENHLRYELDGQIYPLRSSKGDESIRIFNLKETRLRDERRKKIDVVVPLIGLKRTLIEQGQNAAAEEVEDILQKSFLSENCNFAGVSRFVLKHPEEFGIET